MRDKFCNETKKLVASDTTLATSGTAEGIRTPDLLVRSAYETVPIGKISCKTVPFGLVSAFWDARNWENSMVKKAFGRLMDGKNR